MGNSIASEQDLCPRATVGTFKIQKLETLKRRNGEKKRAYNSIRYLIHEHPNARFRTFNKSTNCLFLVVNDFTCKSVISRFELVHDCFFSNMSIDFVA